MELLTFDGPPTRAQREMFAHLRTGPLERWEARLDEALMVTLALQGPSVVAVAALHTHITAPVPAAGRAELGLLSVAPEARGQRLRQQLVDERLRYCHERGLSPVAVTVANNARAVDYFANSPLWHLEATYVADHDRQARYVWASAAEPTYALTASAASHHCL